MVALRVEQAGKGAKSMETSHDPVAWTPEALARLGQVPDGVMRQLTRQRVENLAKRLGVRSVTVELMEEKYREWSEGSARATSELVWTESAQTRIERVPGLVRGMVRQAVEAYAQKRGILEVTPEVLEEAQQFWADSGRFHHP